MLMFDVEPTQTVLDVKILVQEKEGIATTQMRLIYKGQQLCVVSVFSSRVCRNVVARPLAAVLTLLYLTDPPPPTPHPRNDTVSVEAAKIEPGAVINMIIALRGGGTGSS